MGALKGIFRGSLVVKKGNENKDSIKALNEVINSEEIRTFIKEKYQGSIVEAF